MFHYRYYSLIVLLGLLLCTTQHAMAQTTNAFSVQQAVDYAMKNSVQVKNAIADIQIQKQSNREFTAIAYPQLNGSVGGTYYFDIPTTTLPDFISPAVYGVLVNNGVKDGNGNPIAFPPGGFGSVPAQFGTKWNVNGGIDFSQIIFDGQVFIGLKARSAAMQLATQSAEVTKEQIKANVYKLYYQLVIGNQQATSIDANITRFEKLLQDTKEIYKSGFVEKLDVDKVQVQLNNLKTEKEKISYQLEMGNAALKFLMNMPQKEILTLTDTLNVDDVEQLSLTDSLSYKNRKEYQQLSTAIKLNEFNVKRYKLSGLPSLISYATYSKNAQRNQFNFFEAGDWFTTALVGVKMNVPLFDGNARRARVEKAKLELNKVNNTRILLEQSIDMEVANCRNKIKAAITTLQTQKENVALAEKVYNTTKLKYEQGLGSNMEIYNAEADLKMAQNNYYGALYDAVIAKIDFQKAIGQLN